MKEVFTTWGPVCRGCGHEHATALEAKACIAEHAAGCREQGGYSDRRPYVIYHHELPTFRASDSGSPVPTGRPYREPCDHND